MEPQTQLEVIRRLKSIEGHVRGVIQMVEADRPWLPLYSKRGQYKGR